MDAPLILRAWSVRIQMIRFCHFLLEHRLSPKIENYYLAISHARPSAPMRLSALIFIYHPMYSGQIKATGVRYCPSIEDKLKKFAERSTHHVFSRA